MLILSTCAIRKGRSAISNSSGQDIGAVIDLDGTMLGETLGYDERGEALVFDFTPPPEPEPEPDEDVETIIKYLTGFGGDTDAD